MSKVDHFQVTRIAELADIGPFLAVDDGCAAPAVVLLEAGGSATEMVELGDQLSASVVLLDPEGRSTSISVDNPDGDRLVRVIHALTAAPVGRTDASAPTHVRLPPIERSDRGSTSMVADHEYDSLRSWLDLTLGAALIRLADEHEQRSIAGWYVSPAGALEALALDRSEPVERFLAGVEALDGPLVMERSALPPELARLAEVFALSDIELRILLLALATELDGSYGIAYGVLQDDMTRRRPGLSLVARLLADPASTSLAAVPDGPGPNSGPNPAQPSTWALRAMLDRPDSLVGAGLLRLGSGSASTLPVDDGLSLSDPVVRHLLGDGPEATTASAGARLRWPDPEDLDQADAAEPTPGGAGLTGGERLLARRLRSVAAARSDRPLVNPIGGATGWFEPIVAAAGIPITTGDLSACADTGPVEQVRNWVTLCRLNGSSLLVNGLEHLDRRDHRLVGSELDRARTRLPLVGFSGDEYGWLPAGSPVWRLQAPGISWSERADLWLSAGLVAGVELDADQARYLAATLPISPSEMATCIGMCRSSDGSQTVDDRPLTARLQQAARELSREPLPPAVRRIETVFDWDDLVVPEPVMESLRTISAHVAHAGRVFEEWGFKDRMPYGQGLAALFSGPSGTGKTMAARIIAGDLGVDLLQVDLSKTVSKYIGETEKNLDAAFRAAEDAGAVLLFDEADALFGKRTEVKDSHDRHANVEVAYLLQRIEAFPGLAVLTSNLKQNIDNAFLRRLRFSVDFPMPNAAEREAIWRRSFPPAAPQDPALDLCFLARRLKLAGGSIQQIALHAAFAASAEDTSIGMSHVVAAARQELVKIGMLNTEKTLEVLAA